MDVNVMDVKPNDFLSATVRYGSMAVSVQCSRTAFPEEVAKVVREFATAFAKECPPGGRSEFGPYLIAVDSAYVSRLV